ncbi:MAG: Uma2 family endonuclease [Planctomycetes bacterium]|nr:Uma2 family endonuclease [Planctomycetota bacterium]
MRRCSEAEHFASPLSPRAPSPDASCPPPRARLPLHHAAKDYKRLRERYPRAGVREYWIVDARGAKPTLFVLANRPEGYAEVAVDSDGFAPSPVLGLAVRLVRLPPRANLVRYRLDSRHLRRP